MIIEEEHERLLLEWISQESIDENENTLEGKAEPDEDITANFSN